MNNGMIPEAHNSALDHREDDNDSSQMEKGLFFQDPTDENEIDCEMVKGYINNENSNQKHRNSNEFQIRRSSMNIPS